MAFRDFYSVGIAGAFAAVAGLGLATTAMATPVLTVSINGGSPTTETLVGNGSGGYAAAAGSTGGFSWLGVAVTFSSGAYDQLAVSPLYLLDTNQSGSPSSTIAFTASVSGLSASPNSFLSIQGAGSATASEVGASQTAEFSGSAVSTSGTVGTQNSGAISLNPASSVQSTAVSYSGLGQNLSAYTGNLTLNAVAAFTLDPGAKINTANTTINLNTATVGTPEPATMGLFAIGGLALLAMRRRRMA